MIPPETAPPARARPSAGSRRLILRGTHLVLAIPILGYIYGRPDEVERYATAVRYVFVPVVLLSGFWMYAGVGFAVAGVAVWLGAFQLWGSGAAILCEAAFFLIWKGARAIQARRSR